MARINNLVVENATIIFRNFSGKGDDMNREGDRHFTLVIDDPEQAEALLADGWNLKEKDSTREPGTVYWTLKVAVRFDNVPPTVQLFSGKSRVKLDEGSIGILDQIEFETVDVIITPYHWVMGNKEGIKAYLKSMYVRQKLDPIEEKWNKCYADDEDNM